MKLQYSKQALMVIYNLKEFDKADFEQWYSENMMIGNRDIMAYIVDKEQKRGKK